MQSVNSWRSSLDVIRKQIAEFEGLVWERTSINGQLFTLFISKLAGNRRFSAERSLYTGKLPYGARAIIMPHQALEFENLPLIEVAVRRVIEPHVPMSLPLVLSVMQSLEDDFEIEDLEAIEQPPGVIQLAPYAVHATAGFRLIHRTTGVTVSCQKDMLTARWQRSHGIKYPRFPALVSALDRVASTIKRCSVVDFRVSVVNVSYANRIEATGEAGNYRPDPWPISDAWFPAALAEAGQAMELQHVHRTEGGIDRRLVLQYREDGAEQNRWFLLITAAGTAVSSSQKGLDAEVLVHDSLKSWFPELLSKRAKERFGLKT